MCDYVARNKAILAKGRTTFIVRRLFIKGGGGVFFLIYQRQVPYRHTKPHQIFQKLN